MARNVGIAGAAFLLLYALASMAAGQGFGAFGDVLQVAPPLAYAAVALWLSRQSRGQVRTFWNLNAIHGLTWAIGQAVWTYYGVVRGGGVPIMSAADPLFFVSSIPLFAALYGRPQRDRPRWLFDIVLLDLVLIALFSAFVYIYFVLTIAVTDGREDLYRDSVTQLFNARNLLLAGWATYVWRVSRRGRWRRVLGVYAAGLAIPFVAGIVFGFPEQTRGSSAGSLWAVSHMLSYVLMTVAAAIAYDENLFEPEEEAAALSRLPVVSMIAITLLVAIPVIDEVARRLLEAAPETQSLRTRIALTMMIPFGIVVVVREFLSRQALGRSVQELATAREQLVQKEKLAAVGQLVSGLAHELNNPLQGVLGYSELLLAASPAEFDTEELKAIRDNANRAAGIVRNLLIFSGDNPSAPGWQPINRIVRDAVARREAEIMVAGINLRLDLADDLPLVYADPARLQSVIANLVENAEAAIAARRDGKAVLPVVPANGGGEIEIGTRLEHDQQRIIVDVADNGSGLQEADVGRIFDPFFTTREVGKGTGLGLSVCYGIVREHGGDIDARNRPSGGAVFTVRLPVAPEAVIASTAAAARVAPAASYRPLPASAAFQIVEPAEGEVDHTPRRRRALVVDDEESNAALVRRALSGSGYDVESTTLSRRALAMIEREPYDAVIADVKMPELSGPELYGRVCQIRPEMARRFIFITGDIDGEDTRQFLDESRCSYFMKPFNLETLTAAVDTLTGVRS
jgi:signal transduction histidine kinase/CheY-like chemotaxis protein